MAAIGIQFSDNSIIFNCSGAIITDQYILTASNCFKPKSTIVRVGTLGYGDSIFPGHTCVKSFEVTEEFSNNKLSLLKLNKKINFNTVARPICLPKNGYLLTYNTLLTYTESKDRSKLGGLTKISVSKNQLIEGEREWIDEGSIQEQYNHINVHVVRPGIIKYSRF